MANYNTSPKFYRSELLTYKVIRRFWYSSQQIRLTSMTPSPFMTSERHPNNPVSLTCSLNITQHPVCKGHVISLKNPSTTETVVHLTNLLPPPNSTAESTTPRFVPFYAIFIDDGPEQNLVQLGLPKTSIHCVRIAKANVTTTFPPRRNTSSSLVHIFSHCNAHGVEPCP